MRVSSYPIPSPVKLFILFVLGVALLGARPTVTRAATPPPGYVHVRIELTSIIAHDTEDVTGPDTLVWLGSMAATDGSHRSDFASHTPVWISTGETKSAPSGQGVIFDADVPETEYVAGSIELYDKDADEDWDRNRDTAKRISEVTGPIVTAVVAVTTGDLDAAAKAGKMADEIAKGLYKVADNLLPLDKRDHLTPDLSLHVPAFGAPLEVGDWKPRGEIHDWRKGCVSDLCTWDYLIGYRITRTFGLHQVRADMTVDPATPVAGEPVRVTVHTTNNADGKPFTDADGKPLLGTVRIDGDTLDHATDEPIEVTAHGPAIVARVKVGRYLPVTASHAVQLREFAVHVDARRLDQSGASGNGLVVGPKPSPAYEVTISLTDTRTNGPVKGEVTVEELEARAKVLGPLGHPGPTEVPTKTTTVTFATGTPTKVQRVCAATVTAGDDYAEQDIAALLQKAGVDVRAPCPDPNPGDPPDDCAHTTKANREQCGVP